MVPAPPNDDPEPASRVACPADPTKSNSEKFVGEFRDISVPPFIKFICPELLLKFIAFGIIIVSLFDVCFLFEKPLSVQVVSAVDIFAFFDKSN